MQPEVTLTTLKTIVDGVTEDVIIASVPSSESPSGFEMVGIVQLLATGRRSAQIRRLYVSTQYRNQNIGTRLVQRAEQIARMNCCETMGLSVSDENATVVNFYRKLGYAIGFEYDDRSLAVFKVLDQGAGS